MKAEYARVVSVTHPTVTGCIRKVRCKCTGDGFLTDSKLYKPGEVFEVAYAKVDFFNHNEPGYEACPVCQTSVWYTI